MIASLHASMILEATAPIMLKLIKSQNYEQVPHDYLVDKILLSELERLNLFLWFTVLNFPFKNLQLHTRMLTLVISSFILFRLVVP